MAMMMMMMVISMDDDDDYEVALKWQQVGKRELCACM